MRKEPLYPHIPKSQAKAQAKATVNFSWLSSKIREAINERPSRMTHGYTSENAFFITKDGDIVPYNQFTALLPKLLLSTNGGLITVHSHSAENWKEWVATHGLEEFQTFNAGDLNAFRWLVKRNYGNKYVVIMADGRMDYLEVPPATQAQFARLGLKSLQKLAEASQGEAKENWEKYKIRNYESDRMKLREFASDYGLVFVEGLNWR